MFDYLKALLFKNTSVKQTIFKNTFWLASAESVVKVLGLILVIYVARILGPTEYGKFTFAFSFASVLSIISDLGTIDISTRELSRNQENEKKINDFFTLETVLGIATFIIAFLGSLFITYDFSIRRMIWILTVFAVSNSLFGIVFSFFRARQKMEYEAWIKIIQASFNASAVLLVLFYLPSAENLSYAYLLPNLLILFFTLFCFNFYVRRLSFNVNKNIFKILKMSWPLSFGFMIGWTYIYINSVILGYFGLITENGWYSAASRIAIAAVLPMQLILRSFYPALSNFYISSKEKLQKTWDYFAEILIVLTLPMVAGGILLAQRIISSFYGEQFVPSVLALQLLIIATGISFINYPYNVILVVSDHQKNNFKLLAAGAILNVVLDFIFIPIYGFYSAIVATIISCIMVFLFSVIFSKKLAGIIPFDKKLLKITLLSVTSSLFMCSVIMVPQVYNMNIFIVCSIGIVAYLLSLLVLFSVILRRDYLYFFKNLVNK